MWALNLLDGPETFTPAVEKEETHARKIHLDQATMNLIQQV